MLPSILEVAKNHKVKIDFRTDGKKETMAKCPFCGHDDQPGKEHKYHLSLNTEDEVFKCWVCKESGGVFRFIACLEGVPENEVAERYRQKGKKRRYKPHPAERLTSSQFQLLGYDKKPNWVAMRKRDPAYYKRTRNLIWEEWQLFKAEQKRWAFQDLIVGVQSFSYQKAIERIRERERAIETPILEDVLKTFSLSKRPEWTKKAVAFALHVSNPQKYSWPSTEKEMKAAQ